VEWIGAELGIWKLEAGVDGLGGRVGTVPVKISVDRVLNYFKLIIRINAELQLGTYQARSLARRAKKAADSRL
jgi:hypothetical protein